MARLDLAGLKQLVSDPASLNGRSFEVLKHISAYANSPEATDNATARELTVRLLENRSQLDEQYQELLTSLLRAEGLFPYIEPNDLLSESDQLAYETFRPTGMDEQIVFHRAQAMVCLHLLDGENVILSAPTSFGKSLIIDAMLATHKFANAVIVVPTLALIDETRRRLASRFADRYKIITHPSQAPVQRNIFVYTQERVVDQEEFPKIDFFAIDEFYKLDASGDEGRTGLLNQALYRLLKHDAQFYFLGPNVEALPTELPRQINARFILTDFSTVAVDVETIDADGEGYEELVDLCRGLNEPTLVYCRSPKQTRQVAATLLEAGLFTEEESLVAASDWVGEKFDPDWLFGRALRHGIGIHNGRLPRALAQFVVRAFNERLINFLACTSTLIEGVNTAAKNVIIFDNRVAMRKFDFFTFNNIRGRSGRMFEHFIGRVYLFHAPPQEQLPLVDVPVVTQPSSAPTSLLIQLDEGDLTDLSRERLAPIVAQRDLKVETIRANKGVNPERQIEVAATIRESAVELHPLLAWRGHPRWEHCA
jgi:rhodanese-related sulfurtransferase